ncbi:MAG: NAD(P)-dependent oxidoreductase [Planctomycetota bacterium]
MSAESASPTPARAAPRLDAARPIPALVLHADPAEVLPVLDRCEGLAWRAAASEAEAPSALEEHGPAAVLSIKTSRFAGPVHRLALTWPTVRWFHVGGSGRDHLGDWDPARVTVTDSAGVLAPFLAERALAALLYLSTGLDEHVRAQAERRWAPSRFRSLRGRTLLVVGVGHTGGALARAARAVGMRVVGVRASGAPHPDVDEMHRPEALHALLPDADVLSLHVRAEPATRRLIGAEELALLPDRAIVLNPARGAVLDADALLDALGRNVGAAWLDAFDDEPLPPTSPLWAHPRVLVTPHSADQVDDFPRRFAERFAALWREANAAENS